MAVASAGPYANNLHLAADNHTNTSSLNFYKPDALPDAQPTVSKLWRLFGLMYHLTQNVSYFIVQSSLPEHLAR